MRWNVLLKALIVGVLALAFVVPLVMIWGVVKDRARYRDAITAEVAASTARSQTLVGPLIVVRYRERIPRNALSRAHSAGREGWGRTGAGRHRNLASRFSGDPFQRARRDTTARDPSRAGVPLGERDHR